LLAGQDAKKVSRANVALSKATRPAMELITRHEINWTIVASATPAWAKLVFPELPEDEAVAQLWEAIFRTTRIDTANPVGEWRRHGAHLQSRVKLLNEKRFRALRYTGPGTDLTVGLADDHLWCGGGSTAKNGIAGFPNMPTEEVFTTPHKDRVEGTVTSTKPLSYQGTLIDGIQVEFQGGRIVRASAKQGEAILESMIDTDDGARRLGEVALVPHSSPIAQSGLLFWNTLFDENAASHIALGQSYSTCLINGDTLSESELSAKGANESLIHVDWMIGSGELDVDGVWADGSSVPLMRKGEWV
jgi:aminopeptidase